jgi:hypothetical protein
LAWTGQTCGSRDNGYVPHQWREQKLHGLNGCRLNSPMCLGSRVAGEGRPMWTWNGDHERPTLAPSVVVRLERGDGGPTRVCHSFVRDGRIQFLADSTHALAGQTAPLPALPEHWQ